MTATRDRHFRCDDDLWAAAKAAAAAEGRTVTDVLIAALRRLVAPERAAAVAWVSAWADEGALDPRESARQNYSEYVGQIGHERCSCNMPSEPGAGSSVLAASWLPSWELSPVQP
jgi:hypothetical protein